MRLFKNPFHVVDKGEDNFPPSETKQNGFVSPRDLMIKYASGQDLSALRNSNVFDSDLAAPILPQGADLIDQIRHLKRLEADAIESHKRSAVDSNAVADNVSVSSDNKEKVKNSDKES